jgi:hypothetical protein
MRHALLLARSMRDAAAAQLVRYGVDAKAMGTEVAEAGCSQRIVLLPFGKDKQDLEEYQVHQSLPV